MSFLFFQRDCLGLARLGKVGCVNMRGYQKEMKLDCSRVCSFLRQHAKHGKHVAAGILTDGGGQTCGLKSSRSQNFLCSQSLLLFYCPEVSWDPHYVPFHYLGKADTLYSHFLPLLLLLSKLLVIKDHLPLFHID